MAFPAVATTATTNGSTAATNKVCNLPASIAPADGLLLLLRSAAADTHTTPDGWTPLILNNTADASADVFSLWYRRADGTEGATITVNGAASLKFAALAWRITGADFGATPPQVSTVATGTSTAPNPPSLTPSAGALDYLWMWIGSWEGEQTSPPASNPTNYASNVIGANSGTAGTVDTNARCASATRNLNTSSAEDPGSWTISASDDWSAITVAIHPAAPVVPNEDGEGYAFARAVTGVALACALAASQAAALAHASANAWQDELTPAAVAWGNPSSVAPSLWPMTSTAPRLLYVAGDEVLPSAPPPDPAFDHDPWTPPHVVAPVRWVELTHVDEPVVEQPAAPDPLVGNTTGAAPLLWPMASSAARVISMASDEGIVPQPDPLRLEEGTWSPAFVVPPTRALGVQQWQDERVAPPTAIPLDDGALEPPVVAIVDVWIPVPWQYAYNDGTVWSPLDELYWLGGTPVVRPTLAFPAAHTDEVIVAQPTPLRLDEGVWVRPVTVPPTLALDVAQQQDERVVQVALPGGDEGTWAPPFAVPPVLALRIEQWQDERVEQPAPLPGGGEGTWTPPFAVRPTLALEVSQHQDERVAPPAPLGFDEGTWTAPFVPPAVRSLLVFSWQDERVDPPPLTVLGELIAEAGLVPALGGRAGIMPALEVDP